MITLFIIGVIVILIALVLIVLEVAFDYPVAEYSMLLGGAGTVLMVVCITLAL